MVISSCFVCKVAEYADQFVFCLQGGRLWCSVSVLSARWQNMVISLFFVCKMVDYGDQFVFCQQGSRIW
jgi:hypothetical protein